MHCEGPSSAFSRQTLAVLFFAPLIGNDAFYLEGLGNRLLAVLEFFPSLHVYPECWARLKDGAVREDTIPKETVLYDFQKARDFSVNVIRSVVGENTGVTAFDIM